MRSDTTKPNLWLDLDETLISSVPLEEIAWTTDNIRKAKIMPFYNIEDYYIVFERPHLQEFLDFVFKFFNVSIWTAASKDYMQFIIDNIVVKNKPERVLNYALFSYHCSNSKKLCNKTSPKDLRLIWNYFELLGFDRSNTFIIDDLKAVYNAQKKNCFHIKEFYFEKDDSDKDTALLDMIETLKAKFNIQYNSQINEVKF